MSKVTANNLIWRHITHPAGMTVPQLAKVTGLSAAAVRGELNALEAAGKVVRQHMPIGKPHLWWRTEHKPLDDDIVLLAMGLAGYHHKSPAKVRSIFGRLSSRAYNPAQRQLLTLAQASQNPHKLAHEAVLQGCTLLGI